MRDRNTERERENALHNGQQNGQSSFQGPEVKYTYIIEKESVREIEKRETEREIAIERGKGSERQKQRERTLFITARQHEGIHQAKWVSGAIGKIHVYHRGRDGERNR